MIVEPMFPENVPPARYRERAWVPVGRPLKISDSTSLTLAVVKDHAIRVYVRQRGRRNRDKWCVFRRGMVLNFYHQFGYRIRVLALEYADPGHFLTNQPRRLRLEFHCYHDLEGVAS